MFKNYLKIALRNIRKHKLLSGINILGLATAIACCLLIALYVFHETSYDRFHKNANRIVRTSMEFAADGNVLKIAVTGNKVFPEFRREFPEVEDGVRLYPVTAVLKNDEKVFEEKRFVYADSTFFKIFSFKLLQGNPLEVLNKPNQVVLSRSTAKKYFGKEEAIGKSVLVNNEKAFVVTGIIEDCPENSQVKYDILASWYSLTDRMYVEESWWNANYFTYLLLKKPGMNKSLEAKIPGYFKSKDPTNVQTAKNYLLIHVQPLTNVHLDSIAEGGMEPGSDSRYIFIFSAIALLILTIACANYVNLTTARAAERAREVGVRKVIGATRKQLFSQFMGESILTVLLALLVSLLIVKLLLPSFNTIAARQFEFSSLFAPILLLPLVIILIVIGFFGSLYPALILSGFRPVRVLKGNFKTDISAVWLRKSLIVVQFIISVGLIASTIVIHNQLSFIQHKKLGYDRDHVLVLRSDRIIQGKMNTIKSELLSNPNVRGVTICSQTPVFIPGKYSLTFGDRQMNITAVRADMDFIKTMGLELKSGSDFTRFEEEAAFAETDTIERSLIINEAAVAYFGWNNQSAVGKPLLFQGAKSKVIGVVGNFHFSSMREPIQPFVIFLSNYSRNVLVKLSGNQLPQTLEFIRAKWRVLAPHRPFEYEFLDDQFNKLYEAETRTGKIFYAFALLAIALASLGLLGLSTFTAFQRTKEIGIRRVLGASVTGIVALLSKDFLKLVGIAAVIALPFAWWAMNRWLQDFAYRTKLGWDVFLLTAAIALFIAFITVSFQAVRAAVSNPVNSLRSE